MPDLWANTRVIGLIQRFDNAYLVCRAAGDPTAPWTFPTGETTPGESCEAAMRRCGESLLGMRLEIDVGQPPIAAVLEGRPVTLRYFFCGVLGERPPQPPRVEHRWVRKDELLTLPVDPLHADVIRWLAQQPL
ncbi:MAG: NUDIX domain-containing protein [Phycisphaerae bacterium]|nr:NUDIX domain-containing protein [Phycisphaerae bacterium]NUQ08006.1 NUDIX domain-containing protein [Phycisphaerae bacterium]